LFSTIGLGQWQSSDFEKQLEAPLVTAGDDIAGITRFLRPGHESYTAEDVIESLLGAASE